MMTFSLKSYNHLAQSSITVAYATIANCVRYWHLRALLPICNVRRSLDLIALNSVQTILFALALAYTTIQPLRGLLSHACITTY